MLLAVLPPVVHAPDNTPHRLFRDRGLPPDARDAPDSVLHHAQPHRRALCPARQSGVLAGGPDAHRHLLAGPPLVRAGIVLGVRLELHARCVVPAAPAAEHEVPGAQGGQLVEGPGRLAEQEGDGVRCWDRGAGARQGHQRDPERVLYGGVACVSHPRVWVHDSAYDFIIKLFYLIIN